MGIVSSLKLYVLDFYGANREKGWASYAGRDEL